MEDRIIGHVYESHEYEKFRFLLGNRAISRIDRIDKSTAAVGQLIVPIIVNERLEIIEGQHRYESWKRADLPIYYIICEGYGIKECIAMNTTSKNWSLTDYINCYASYGDPNYQALQRYEKKYASKFTASLVRAICCGKMGADVNKVIKGGTFKLCLSEDEINAVFEFLSQFDIPDTVRGNGSRLYAVLRFCYEYSDVNNAILLRQWKAHCDAISGITDIRAAAEAVEKVYNFHRPQKDYVFIATEYRRVAEIKCAALPGGGNSAWRKGK